MRLKSIYSHNLFQKTTSLVIIFCALILGLETFVRHNIFLVGVLQFVDYVIISYFLFEFIVRLSVFPLSNKEELFWLLFDGLILAFSIIALFEGLFTHPEIIATLRILRIFQVLKLFELTNSLKILEKKIFSVIPTVFIFACMLCLMIYVYSIIGMHIYNYRTFTTVNFSDLYSSFTSLFVVITNGWSATLQELKSSSPDLNPFVTDLYVFSFFIFGGMVTFNVFIAVLTTQIQDKFSEDIDRQYEILERIENLEIKIQSSIKELEKKLEQKI